MLRFRYEHVIQISPQAEKRNDYIKRLFLVSLEHRNGISCFDTVYETRKRVSLVDVNQEIMRRQDAGNTEPNKRFSEIENFGARKNRIKTKRIEYGGYGVDKVRKRKYIFTF